MADPFDTIVDSSLAKDAYGGIYSAQYGDAIKSAKANEMATRLGLPPEIVESDYPNMMAEDRLRKRIEETRKNQAYARIMANPRLAASAIDDDELPKVAAKAGAMAAAQRNPRMGMFGDLRGAAISNVLGGLLSSVSGVAQYVGGGADAAQNENFSGASRFGLLGLNLLGSGSRDTIGAGGKKLAIRTNNRNVNDVLSGFESFGGSIPGLAATVVGGPMAGSLVMGASTGGRSYEEGRNAGLTAQQAFGYGSIDAGIEMATEFGPQKFFGDAIKPGRSLLRSLGFMVGTELPGEAAATALQEMNKWYFIERPKGVTFGEYAAELPDELRSTMVATVTMLGLTGGVSIPLRHAAERRQSQQSAEAVDSIMESAALSPTRSANPTQFTEALNQLVGDTAAENLYVPAEQIQALFQSEDGTTKDVTADPFWGKYAQQLQEASALGGDVIVPLADIATHLAGSPQWQALRDYVRTSPQGASISEAKAKQTPEELDKLAGDIAGRLEKQVRSIAQREAMATVNKWAEGLGYSGEKATAINRYLASWLTNSHAAETAKRIAAGEAPVSIQEFAVAKLPDKAKMAQADYDAAQADLIDNPERAAAQSAPVESLDARLKKVAKAAKFPIKQLRANYAEWQKRDGDEAAMQLLSDKETELGLSPQSDTLNQDPLQDGARGNISIERDEAGFMSASLVRAFESANFSTAIHELGHFFLEDLRTRALRGDATDTERADWQAFKDWAGEQGQPIDDGKTIPVEAHEYFARGMERYVWEGQAPSKGLRAVFARMREFMLELYRTATAFNAPLTPEIREVMDRMLASDAEIEEQRAEMKASSAALRKLLSDKEKEGYDELIKEADEASKTQVFERILSALLAEKRAEVRERKREMRVEVEEVVDGQPIMQALKLLRTGIKDADGNANNVRLSREWLIDTYGEGIVAQLPKGVPPILGDTDTMDADQIAEMTGYSSGDAMVKDLIEHEAQRQEMKAGGDKRSPRSKAIADIVDARIRDEIGDPYADLEEEAKAALASDKQADAMSMELRAIARKTSGRPTPWKLAVEWARERVSTQTAKEALSGTMLQMYARNAAKAGQAVEEALIKQDYAEAFQAKQRQMLNMALLSEARKAKETVDKAVRRMQKIASKATIRSVDQDYLDQAHQLLEDVDMKTRPQSRIDKRLAFEAWHSNQIAMGIEPVVPAEYRSLLGRTNWSRLPIDELLEMDATVGQIVELGRLKQKLRDNKAERDYEEGVAEAEAVADTVSDRAKSPTTDDRKSIMGLLRSKLRSADAAMLTAERVMSWMDNGEANGPWTRLIYNVMAEAQGNEKDLARDYVEQLNELIRSLDPKLVRGWDRKVDTPELMIRTREHSRSGEAWAGTKDQIVMMAMNWGNAGNRQRLIDGFGWDEAAMEAVLERHMTKADWDFVQSTWDIVDTLWPQIEAMERRVNGVAPDKVEASEINTPFGVYRGGYFPAVYDPNESSAASINEDDKQSPQGGWHKATTRASASKARAAVVKGRPMMLSLDVVTRHMGEVIHDVTHREAVHQVRKLLTDKRIRSAINRKLGPEYARALGSWIDNIAQPGIAYSKAAPWTVAVGRYLHKAIGLVGLGFRVSTVLLQPLGSLPAIGEIGAKNIGHGYRIFVANPAKAMREIHRRSAFMRARADNFDASIEQMRQAAGGGLLKKVGFPSPIITEIGERGLSKYAFQGIAYADMMVSGSAWIGAFDKSTAEGMSEDEAALYADSIVRKTQGAGGTADTSLLMNEHPIIRSFYPFFSYLNALYGMQRDIGRRVRTAESAGDYADSMRRLWWVAVAPIIAQAILFGEGPDEEDEEGWTAHIGKQLVMGNLASIPGVGAISAALGNGYGYRASAIQSVGEGIVKAKDDAAKVIEEGGEYEPTGSVIKRTMTTLGLLAAKPLGQIGTTAGGAYDYATGEAEPEDAGDVYELLTKGKVSDNPRPMERMMGEEG